MTNQTPSAEQDLRARYDLVLADLEKRQEEVRQLKTIDLDKKLAELRYEPWKVAFAGLGTGAALLAAGAALGAYLQHLAR